MTSFRCKCQNIIQETNSIEFDFMLIKMLNYEEIISTLSNLISDYGKSSDKENWVKVFFDYDIEIEDYNNIGEIATEIIDYKIQINHTNGVECNLCGRLWFSDVDGKLYSYLKE